MVGPRDQLVLDFTVKAVRSGQVEAVVFRELLVRRTIVSVHMKNNTASCDRQLAQLAAHAAEFAALGFDVIAVSRDSAGSHLRYAAAKGISFTLVSDPQDSFSRAADAIVEKSMYGRRFLGPVRAAYVLEKDGTVLGVIEKVDPAHHARQVRERIDVLSRSVR
jgi:peroxiredoxin Q/BCP